MIKQSQRARQQVNKIFSLIARIFFRCEWPDDFIYANIPRERLNESKEVLFLSLLCGIKLGGMLSLSAVQCCEGIPKKKKQLKRRDF